MSEAISHRNHHPGPLNPPVRQAIRLWLACHRLGDMLEDLSAQAPPASSLDWPETPERPWPTPPMPVDQLDFQEWLRDASTSIFGCDGLPDWPVISLDAPKVKGIIIYAARCGTFKFYTAWVEWSGTFIGWLKVQPAVERIDPDYAVGEISGRPLFLGITLDLSGHMAIGRFVQVLKDVARDLGLSEGRVDLSTTNRLGPTGFA